MTEKRFTSQRTDDYNYSDILDNGKWIGICHVDCEDDFVDKLNELAEENKLHKERISLLSSLLDLADAIIDTSDNEKAKKVWENKNEQTEKEWEKILND